MLSECEMDPAALTTLVCPDALGVLPEPELPLEPELLPLELPLEPELLPLEPELPPADEPEVDVALVRPAVAVAVGLLTLPAAPAPARLSDGADPAWPPEPWPVPELD
jgi:hypothetical protein